MADRSIVVRLRAQVDGFKSEMAAAAKATEQVGKAGEESAKHADTAMGRMVQSATQNQGAWTTAGATLTGFGAASLGALGLATKAAMDWESAWAGVTKTTDGTAAQMAALEGGLRDLATSLPASHTEIAAVAEAAGQLGVAREDIVGFTRTMIDLGETTNLTADEAATNIAQFTNVMKTSTDDVDNLGAALVALGNDGASTEADILNMAQRLSGTGNLIGASEQSILGLSSALSSVGISAEMGGGALSRVLQDMNTAVLDGGEKLDTFASVAGMSAEQFTAAWQKDPVLAMNAFLQGLDGVTKSGGNAVGVLSDLGIKSTEETRALLSLAGAGDLLVDSLDTANKGWADNTALVAEAAKRYDTAESRIKIAGNRLVDLGIDIGGVVLPALADLVEKGADLVGWVQDLPEPVKAAGTAVAGIAGAASLGAGGFLLLVPKVLDTVNAFQTLRADSPDLAAKLGKVGKAAVIAGTAFAALTTANAVVLPLLDDGKVTELDAYAAALTQLGDGKTAKGIQDLNAAFTDSDWLSGLDVNGVKEAYQVIADPSYLQQVDNFASKMFTFGQRGSSDVEFVTREWEKLDQTLAGMASSGNTEKVQATLQALANEAGVSVADLSKQLPTTAAAMDKVAASGGEASDGITQVGDAADDASTSVDDLYDSVSKVANAFLDQRGAIRNWEKSLDDVAEAVEKNGRTLDEGTEKGRANASALDDMAESAWKVAQTMRDNGEAPGEFLQGARDRVIETAKAMGMGQTEAEEYAKKLGLTPEFIGTQMTLDTADAEAKLESYSDLLTKQVQEKVETKVEVDTASGETQITGFAGTMEAATEDKSVTITADPSGAITSAGEAKAAVDSVGYMHQVNIDGDVGPLISKVDRGNLALAYLEAQKAEPTVGLNDEDFIGVMSASEQRLREIDGMTPTPELKAEKAVLERVVQEGQDRVNGMHGTEVDVTARTNGYAGIEALQNRINSTVGKTVYVDVKYRGIQAGYDSATGNTPGPWAPRATGGPIYGPGTGTSDSVPILASNGEHMLTAREVSMLGGQDATYRMRAAIRAGALRFADGGGIGVAPSRMAPAPYLDPRLLAVGPVASSTARVPLIGTLSVPPAEGQSPQEQGQFIAGYLGARFDL